MKKQSKIVKIMPLLMGCFILCFLFPVNVHAERSTAEIKKVLNAYSDWFTWHDKDSYYRDYTYMECPKKNVSQDAMIRYIDDIIKTLDGRIGTDYTRLSVCFNMSLGKYGQDYEKFKEDMFDFKGKLNYRWPYWSRLNAMDLHPGWSEVGDEILDYHVNVYLDLNGENDTYNKKVTEVVQAAKKAVGNDHRKLANYFGKWLFDWVDYDIYLITNNPYLALIERTGNCGCYANAIRDLCDEAGIPALVLTSDELNHAWNEIYIDGKWYTMDLLSVVSSKSNQNDVTKGEYLFDDPSGQCDDPAFLQKLKTEMLTPTPVLSRLSVLNVSGDTNIKKYIRNTVSNTKISYQSLSPSIVTVNADGTVHPVGEGTAKIKITVVQNGKTYQFQLSVKSKTKFPKKGSQITYKNGIYKVVKPAKKSGTKIVAGTVEWAGLSNKAVGSFAIPQKIKSGSASYTVVSIGKTALKNNGKIKKLTIPSSITKIGSQAFYGCRNLRAITIKTSKLTSKNVGSKAFQSIYKKAVIKVPKKKWKSYKTLLKSKGIAKTVKVKK